MKKRIALLAGMAMMVAGGVVSTGHADPVQTPLGSASVNEGGYILVLDGTADNPDPLDGYISVDQNGKACASDEGTPGDTNEPTCAN